MRLAVKPAAFELVMRSDFAAPREVVLNWCVTAPFRFKVPENVSVVVMGVVGSIGVTGSSSHAVAAPAQRASTTSNVRGLTGMIDPCPNRPARASQSTV